AGEERLLHLAVAPEQFRMVRGNANWHHHAPYFAFRHRINDSRKHAPEKPLFARVRPFNARHGRSPPGPLTLSLIPNVFRGHVNSLTAGGSFDWCSLSPPAPGWRSAPHCG